MKYIHIGAMAVLLIGVGAARPLAQTPPAQTTQAPAASAANAPAAEKGQILQRILVKVNGEILTQTDLEELQINELQRRNKDVNNTQDLRDNATLRALLVEITPTLLVGAIDELMELQRARELGYKVTDAEIKDAIDNIKKDNKLDDASLLKALESQGMTLDQLRKNFERTGMLQQLEQREIMSHVALTEEEAHQYYAKHQSDFLSPPTITLREILITATPSTFGSSSALSFSGSSDSAAQARIQAVLDRLHKGEDFAAVAAEVSDAQSKARGGLMTPVSTDDLSDAIRTATEKLKPGEVTGSLKTTRGYQVFKVEARTAQSVQPFDQVHQAIMQKIFDQRRGGEVKKYLDRLRQQALIEWKDEDLKRMYEAKVNGK